MHASKAHSTNSIIRHVLPVEGGDLPMTIAQGEGTGATVVIMPSAFGIGPDLIAQMQDLAASASAVVALDPFFREDAGPISYEDHTRVMKRVQGFDKPRGYHDLRVAIDWLRSERGSRSVMILGICLGGPHALLAAADGIADGAITWHGTWLENHLERAAEMHCPMRLHFGGADPFAPQEAVNTVRAAFAGRNDVRIAVHDGATHGFSHRAALRAYDERAERAGMDSVRELTIGVGR